MHSLSWEAAASIMIIIDFFYAHRMHFKKMGLFVIMLVMTMINTGGSDI